MHCFRYDELDSCMVASLIRLDKEESNHLFKTLRAAPGQECLLTDGKGRRAKAKVLPGKTLEILSLEEIPLPAQPLLHMYIAPPRRQKMDLILRSAAELGVWRIVPMFCERSVSLPDHDSVDGRWKEVLFEACKQSGNPFLPQVAEPVKFEKALEDSRTVCPKRYFGSVRECPERETNESVPPANAAWFVGPEGGFTEKEEEAMIRSGVTPLHFGNWVLRVETAAICGLALIHSFLKKSSL